MLFLYQAYLTKSTKSRRDNRGGEARSHCSKIFDLRNRSEHAVTMVP
jgi:hypothetical protein